MNEKVKRIFIQIREAPFWSFYWDKSADRVYRSFLEAKEKRYELEDDLQHITVQRIEPNVDGYAVLEQNLSEALYDDDIEKFPNHRDEWINSEEYGDYKRDEEETFKKNSSKETYY